MKAVCKALVSSRDHTGPLQGPSAVCNPHSAAKHQRLCACVIVITHEFTSLFPLQYTILTVQPAYLFLCIAYSLGKFLQQCKLGLTDGNERVAFQIPHYVVLKMPQ